MAQFEKAEEADKAQGSGEEDVTSTKLLEDAMPPCGCAPRPGSEGAARSGESASGSSAGKEGFIDFGKNDKTGEQSFDQIGKVRQDPTETDRILKAFELMDPKSDASINANADKVLANLNNEHGRLEWTNVIQDAIKNGTADKLVEKLNEKLKESGSDLRFTLDNHADTKYNPDNVETTINLYDSKTGNKVDLFGAAQPKNQLEKQYGDLNGSKDAGFNPEQNVAGYEKGPMNEKEVAETAQRIAEAIQNGKDGQKLDVTYLLMQAERRGSLEAVVKALNDGFKEKGLDIHVGLQKEKMLSTLPHGEKWDDPLNTFNNYNIRVFDGSGKQLKDYPFSQSYYEKLTPEQKQQLFIESLRRR